MTHTPRLALLIALILLIPAPAPAAEVDGFTPLFNGKDLTGWVPCNVATGQI